MALATQCPHCHTTFRVVHDQLKLRAGLVRCGSCKQIFNGIQYLLRPDQVGQVPTKNTPDTPRPPDIKHAVADKPVRPAMAEPTRPPAPPPPPVEFTEPDTSIEEESHFLSQEDAQFIQPEREMASDDPMQRMTLLDFTQVEGDEEGDAAAREALTAHFANTSSDADPFATDASAGQPDPLDQAMEDLQQKPWRGDNTAIEHDPVDDMIAAEADEPGFVIQGRRRQRIGRMLRTFMVIASFVLMLALIGQSAYIFRNQIAAWVPEAKPYLSFACELIDCQVSLLAQIDSVSIESSELQALSQQKNMFALTILLRNYSATEQAWPNIELTLNDANERTLVRRIFTPRDYLPSKQDMVKGFAANSEQPVKVPFELLQLKASGYRVYLFYP